MRRYASRCTNDGDDVEYIRDPLDKVGFRDGFREDSTLSADAEFSGYRSGRENLWIEPENPDAIFIVDRSSIERLPCGEAPVFG